MRPTFLQFRSPKEQTGEFLNPSVTNDGKSLKYQSKPKVHSTFPRSQRWEHIRELACRTGFKMGPGCYEVPITTNKGRSPKIVRPSATFSNGFDYVYVGDSIIKKERPVSRGGTSEFRSSKGFYSELSHTPKDYYSEKSPSLYKSAYQGFYDVSPVERTPKTYYSSSRPASAPKKRPPSRAEFFREFLAVQSPIYQDGQDRTKLRTKGRSMSQERPRPKKAKSNILYENEDEEWALNQGMVFRNPKKRMQSGDYRPIQNYVE